MRKITYCIVAVIVVYATLFTVLALTLPPSPSREPEPINIIIGEGELRVEVEKDIFHVGEPVHIRVFQKNLNSYAIGGGIGYVVFEIRNAYCHSVISIGRFVDWVHFSIPSNEEIELQSILPIWQQTNMKGQQVPLGTYTIQLELDGKTAEFQITIIR